MIPTKKQISQVRQLAKKIPNKGLNQTHYGVFLLTFGAGLRVSEAVDFDFQKQTNGLYLVATKGGGVRGCVISDKLINELKENNWRPKKTNRFNFAKYCQRLKKETKLPEEVELTPHTGRRAFATYQAEGGTPLPVLAQMLGHKSKKTTAEYYWRENQLSIYENFRGAKAVRNEFDTTTQTEPNNWALNREPAKLFTNQIDILKPVKDRFYWKEYNQKRKDYLKRKNKELYQKRKCFFLTTAREKKNKIEKNTTNFTTNPTLQALQEYSGRTINTNFFTRKLEKG